MSKWRYLPSFDCAYRVAQTKDFLRSSSLLYHDVTVRVIDFSGNSVRVRDSGEIERIVRREDMSWASWHIAVDNEGCIVTLKIRRWAA